MPALPVGRARHLSGGPGFGAQVRGYRMDQVDTVLDSLEARIAEHDLEIALLRGEVPATPGWPTTPPTDAVGARRAQAGGGRAAPSTGSGSRP